LGSGAGVKAFRSVTGPAAVLDRPNIDTDQIVPKQFLKRIDRTGYGEFLFYDWRKDPGFELNRPEFAGAKILLTGANFGCGSSREHAAWALQQYGFDVVVAPSFGDIFFGNAVQTGLVPVILPGDELKRLMAVAADGSELTVDLEAETITDPGGRVVPFTMEPFARDCLLQGLDAIARTLQHEAEIAAFEARSASPVATTELFR
jgi:3-isopropylmalate/(R)-2-methylmalate dehydratase small subunit